jgi:hypothetical protein
VQVAIPDSASWQSNETVTLVLCQPATFADGVTVDVIVGGVVSVGPPP